MGWLLVIAADVCLTGDERTMTFVELGCGESYLAISRALGAVMSSRTALPVAILDRLTRWLDGYTGSPEEPRLRAMLGEIRAQQTQSVPLRGQRVQCSAVDRHSTALSTLACRRQHEGGFLKSVMQVTDDDGRNCYKGVIDGHQNGVPQGTRD